MMPVTEISEASQAWTHSHKNKHGLAPNVDYLSSEEIHRLQQQNSILRAVVNQMRKDMEGLSHIPLHPQTHPRTSPLQPVQHPGARPATSETQMGNRPPTQSADMSFKVNPADYSEALEQEVSLLKARCRHLQEQLEGAKAPHSLARAADNTTEDLAPEVPHNSDIRHQGREKGGRCQVEKRGNTSALEEQEVREAHAESALISMVEQSAPMRQLREENLRLRQQQASGLMSGGVLDENHHPLLHARLKQAALCVTRLSIEKQQLIQMGNRLRAQITAAGLQEAAEPQKDSSTKTQGAHHDRLSTLEQLQYQLTTQELQYALRQRDRTSAEQLLETNSRGPAPKGAANPWAQGHKAPDRPEHLSGLSRSLLSSEESLRSLKELWEKLDHGLSPSIFSEAECEQSRTEVAESGGAGVQMMMHGVSAPIHIQPPPEGKQRRNTSSTPSNTYKTKPRPGASGGISKIRNYNVKD